jgi:hypothetical protein
MMHTNLAIVFTRIKLYTSYKDKIVYNVMLAYIFLS